MGKLTDDKATYLETLDEETGKPPESRISSATAARSLIQSFEKSNQQRALNRSRIQGLIDGNPPYNRADLKRLGQGHRSNVNFREAEGYVDGRTTNYYELIMEVPRLVDITVSKSHQERLQPSIRWGEIIAEEFTTMLQDWEDFLYNMMLHQDEMIKFGIGPVYWENERDWRFSALKAGSFLLPENTKATLGKLPVCAFRDTMLVDEMYKMISTPGREVRAREEGWDPELMKQAIMDASYDKANDKSRDQTSYWESYQTKIRANSLAVSLSEAEVIRINHLLVKEFDGRISHFIVRETKDDQKFLFKKLNRFESFERVLRIFTLNIGDGSYYGVKGLGTKIFGTCEINNRMLNTTIDGAMAAATVLLQPRQGGVTAQKARIVRLGPITLLPDGFDVVTGSFNPNLDGLVKIRSLLQQLLNQNVGTFRPGVGAFEEGRKTGKQFTMEVMNETKLEKKDINMYYVQWDKLYDETLRRALSSHLLSTDPGYEAAQKFRQRCLDRHVPEELLDYDMLGIKAVRAIGFGSPIMKSLITQEVVGMSPFFDERGKQNATRDWLAARVGYAGVDRYLPLMNRDQIPTNEHTIASLENNDLIQGQQVWIGVDQLHVIHLQVHLGKIEEIIQQWSQSGEGDIFQILTAMQAMIEHSAQHLDLMRGDPAREEEYKQFEERFKALAKTLKVVEGEANKQAAEEQRRVQEQQQAIAELQEKAQGNEMQVKLADIQADLQIKLTKETNMQRVRELKAQHQMSVRERLANQKIAEDQRKQQVQIEEDTRRQLNELTGAIPGQ